MKRSIQKLGHKRRNDKGRNNTCQMPGRDVMVRGLVVTKVKREKAWEVTERRNKRNGTSSPSSLIRERMEQKKEEEEEEEKNKQKKKRNACMAVLAGSQSDEMSGYKYSMFVGSEEDDMYTFEERTQEEEEEEEEEEVLANQQPK